MHCQKTLDEKKIQSELKQLGFSQPYDLYCFSTIDSTSRFLNDLNPEKMVTICCSEEQTAGHGRFNRYWHSPAGENIYCSGRWRLPRHCLKNISTLSLVIGLAIVECLKPQTDSAPMLLKWPNDILWQQKKLCGILIELNNQTLAGHVDVIIGIGLNVNSAYTASNEPFQITKPACSLFDITGQSFDRNYLIAALLVTIQTYLEKFCQSGFCPFKSNWENLDYLKNQYISIKNQHELLTGYACGINEKGQLCLKDDQGIMHYLSAGEASLNVE